MWRTLRLLALTPLCFTGCLGTAPTPSGAAGGGNDAGTMAPGPTGTGLSSTTIPALTADALFVVNGGDSTISVIDVATNAVIGTITLNNAMFPHHIYLSYDHLKLLVAVPGMDLSLGHAGTMGTMGGAVMVLNASTGATLVSRQLDAMNHNATFSPDSSEVWTSQMMTPGSVLVLDAKTLATNRTIPVGDMPAEITLSKHRNDMFVANGMSDSVSVIHWSPQLVLMPVTVGKDPVGAWPGLDGLMYTTNELGKSITAFDGLSLAVVRTYNLGFTPGMAATPPNTTGQLWITDEDNGKVVFNSTTADMKMGELAVGVGAHGLAFSDDGKTGYVTNQTDNSVSVIDVATHALKATIKVGKKPNGLAYRGMP